MEIILAHPRGFCGGVKKALCLIEKVLATHSPPIYGFHEIVHNQYIVNDLKKRGVVFVDDIESIPIGAPVIFSAHGVSSQVEKAAKARNLKIFNATCPLVAKMHQMVKKTTEKGNECILIGHRHHVEIEGTLGQYEGKERRIFLVETIKDIDNIQLKAPKSALYLTQTTLSIDETKAIIQKLHQTFPDLPKQPGNICLATEKRQEGVRKLAKMVNKIIVIGSHNSSNSQRLKELANNLGMTAYLIDDPSQLNSQWFDQKEKIGITAGASAPEILVQKTVNWFEKTFENVKT